MPRPTAAHWPRFPADAVPSAGSWSARELMRIHLDVLFTRDADGRLLRVNEPDGKEAPRFFLGRTREGNEWRFRADLPENLVEALEAACRDEPPGPELLAPPHEAQRYEALLAASAPIRHRWAGPAYFFARALPAAAGPVPVTEANLDLLRPHLEDWCADVLLRQPAMMLLDQGRGVSLCCRARARRQAGTGMLRHRPALHLGSIACGSRSKP